VVNLSNEVVILTKEAKVVGPSPRSNENLGLVVSSCKDRHDRHVKCQKFAAQVVKGDAQKADGAAVPGHLWIHAFLEGYAKGGEEGDALLHLLRP
jgi:hypothetical protein